MRDHSVGVRFIYGSLRVVNKSVANSEKSSPWHPVAAHPRAVVVSPGRSPMYSLSACETGTQSTAWVLLCTLVFVQRKQVCMCMCETLKARL